MDWKEFLKPTKWKIILFIALLLFAPVFSLKGYICDDPGICTHYVPFLELATLEIEGIYMSVATSLIKPYITVGVIIPLFGLYILSSVLIFLYTRLEEKTKN